MAGWSVERRLIRIRPEEAAHALWEVRRRATGIFNHNAEAPDDHLRLQLLLPDSRAPVASGLAERARVALQRQGGRPCQAAALLSLAGCQQQALHTDFSSETIHRLWTEEGVEPPEAYLVGVSEGGRLVLEGATIPLHPGDAICFDGDVVHAGASYGEDNLRIHFYAEADPRVAAQDQTFLVVE